MRQKADTGSDIMLFSQSELSPSFASILLVVAGFESNVGSVADSSAPVLIGDQVFSSCRVKSNALNPQIVSRVED